MDLTAIVHPLDSSLRAPDSFFASRLRNGRSTNSASNAALPSAGIMTAKTVAHVSDCERTTSHSATSKKAALKP